MFAVADGTGKLKVGDGLKFGVEDDDTGGL
jgi:hypothetical protein